jgi:hypothetical protein
MEAELNSWQGKSLMETEPFHLEGWPKEEGGYKRFRPV